MFQTCFECGRHGEVLQSHPLPISPLLQTPENQKNPRVRKIFVRNSGASSLGACAMTTKFLDNKFALSEFYCRGVSHGKTAFLDDFPLCPQAPPTQKQNFYFYCRLAVSEKWLRQFYGLGDGMGGGRNGWFWGAPILHILVEKRCIFQGFGQHRGAPKRPFLPPPIPSPT